MKYYDKMQRGLLGSLGSRQAMPPTQTATARSKPSRQQCGPRLLLTAYRKVRNNEPYLNCPFCSVPCSHAEPGQYYCTGCDHSFIIAKHDGDIVLPEARQNQFQEIRCPNEQCRAFYWGKVGEGTEARCQTCKNKFLALPYIPPRVSGSFTDSYTERWT